MALPKISAPTFSLELPSSGESISYRPFLVKEEKILLIAQEGNDQTEIMNAIVQVLNNCCLDENVDIESLSMFDIEYFFLQIRSRSIGEIVDLIMKCKVEECEKKIPIQINLLKEVEVIKNDKHTTKLQLTKDVGVVMRYQTIKTSIEIKEPENEIENTFNVIINSIESVFDKKTVHFAKDIPREEMEDFLYGLPQTCFDKIKTFFETMPKLQYKKIYKCSEGHENEITVEGLTNFFG